MKFSGKYLWLTLLFLLTGSLFWYLGRYGGTKSRVTDIQQDIVLEQLREVFQMGTAEAVFSEIFSYKDYYRFDYAPFRKKALIRIRAKVLAGYELDSMSWEVLGDKKKIIFYGLPEAKILSIEQELDYYDITEGTFNSFSAEDHSLMQKQTRDFIRKKAEESPLRAKAQKQMENQLGMVKTVLAEYGWTLEIKEKRRKNFWN